jgi:hypothetical protein
VLVLIAIGNGLLELLAVVALIIAGVNMFWLVARIAAFETLLASDGVEPMLLLR